MHGPWGQAAGTIIMGCAIAAYVYFVMKKDVGDAMGWVAGGLLGASGVLFFYVEGWVFLTLFVPASIIGVYFMTTQERYLGQYMLPSVIGAWIAILSVALYFGRHLNTVAIVLFVLAVVLDIITWLLKPREAKKPAGAGDATLTKPTPVAKPAPDKPAATTTATRRTGRGPQRGGNRRRW